MEQLGQILDKVPSFSQLLAHINGMSLEEQRIVAAGLTLILLYWVWRRLGIIPFIAALFVLIFGYVLFEVNIRDFYRQQTAEQNVRMGAVQEEVDRK